ncbi:hypothetical protein ASPVEDRAFT_697848 [Aspergillus versicolor CBS 583.65]|uniref:Uncharacterized protein n=1 Tax=Aspergillus versicolor CBS 583.65 TaxID=1036611 RepID=A0A1L9PN29_ASPVE|nr:uncharacterized protein ASPVEDRAFT_697848 [Aspergillus versicolor CBS 583.65]OJJ02835.1 hypothetical protein ASPVEDRAFT_697848 [Aspergillus versicolor CBS 583.65]
MDVVVAPVSLRGRVRCLLWDFYLGYLQLRHSQVVNGSASVLGFWQSSQGIDSVAWNGVSSRRDTVPLVSSNQGHSEIRHSRDLFPIGMSDGRGGPKEKCRSDLEISRLLIGPANTGARDAKLPELHIPRDILRSVAQGHSSSPTVVRVSSPSIYISSTSSTPTPPPLLWPTISDR